MKTSRRQTAGAGIKKDTREVFLSRSDKNNRNDKKNRSDKTNKAIL